MLLSFELPVGAALIAFLRVRGWTASSLGASRPTLKDVLVGLGLAVVLMLSYAILFVIVGSLRPGTQWISIEDLQSAGQPGLRTILAVSIINPVFEEAEALWGNKASILTGVRCRKPVAIAYGLTGDSLASRSTLYTTSSWRPVAFAMSQPSDVDVNEILFRPTRQDL
jgi:hypothetical protein